MKKLMILSAMLSFGLCLQGVQSAEQESKPAVNATTIPSSAYQAKNFGYLVGHVKGLDDSLLKMHFKLYEGYVTNSNLIIDKLNMLLATGQNRTPEFGALKRLLGWEFNGMLLHEYYFDNLGGNTSGGITQLDSSDPLYAKIQQDFGSYDRWKLDFVSTGLMRGIGWVVSYVEPKSGRLMNEWINEHDLGHLAGATPILIMDVWEHAFITQFALDRNKYIEVFFDNINWNVAASRFKGIDSKKP